MFETEDGNQAMILGLPKRNRRVKYDFSKVRVYLNAAVAILAIVFSVSILTRLLQIMLLAYYFGLTVVVTFLMFKIKVLLIFKAQETNQKKEQPFAIGQIEDKTYAKKRQILFLMGLITLLLILPLILVFVLEPTYWFVSFTSFVTGVSLSEIVLYLSADRPEKLSS